MLKKIPQMIAGDWRPTPDPRGRQVQFTDCFGNVISGTVTGVEFRQYQEPTLHVDIASAGEKPNTVGVSANKLTWLEGDKPPWAASEHPHGRWVIFKGEDGVERCGRVAIVDPRHSENPVLTILEIRGRTPLEIVDVPWQQVKWLPQ